MSLRNKQLKVGLGTVFALFDYVDRPITQLNEFNTMPDDSQQASSPKQSSITVSDTLFGTDPPIEKAHPGLQPALVFASYPIMLIVLISVAALYFFFLPRHPNGSGTVPVQTEAFK